MGISISIVFHNEEDKISETLRTLFAAYNGFIRIKSAPVEFIFVDNKSNDHSVDLIKKLCDHSKVKYKILNNDVNNMGLARSKAVEAASYELLLFLDADCRPVGEDWLINYYSKYEELKHRKIAAIGGENKPPSGVSHPLYSSICLLKKYPMLFLGSTQLLVPKSCQRVAHVPTCNVLYVKSAIKDVGGFASDFSRVGEDLDLNMRLTEASWEIYFAEGLLVEHHERESLNSWFSKAFRYGSVQPRILFMYPMQVGLGRWVPIIGLGLGILLTLLLPKIALYLLLFALLSLSSVVAISSRGKWLLYSILFLFGTICFYSLGYTAGICKLVYCFPQKSNATRSKVNTKATP